jgi:hypothetical protein
MRQVRSSFLLVSKKEDVMQKKKWMRVVDSVQPKKAMSVLGLSLVVGVMMLSGARAQAQALKDVVYAGGTALQGNGVHGRLNVTSADTLVFEGPSNLAIPYDRVIDYESTSREKVHVGLLTEAVWRLIAPWPEGKRLSVSYTDAQEHKQVVVLEMSRGVEAMLVEILKTRVPRAVRPVLLPKMPVQAAQVRSEILPVAAPRLETLR